MQIKIVLITSCVCVSLSVLAQDADSDRQDAGELFQTSAQCIACHSQLLTATGQDVSIGYAWRASMMANSARDPYWHAAVRREVTDHPYAQAEIEDECSTCHMPMAHVTAAARGELSRVFANIASMQANPDGHLAADGVSCTVCHQVTPENFGTEASFTGRFVIDTETPLEQRTIYGPHEIDSGRQRLMQSATGFVPQSADHIRDSELCATCHTLYTHAFDEQGNDVGQLPEQVPYLEWLASDYSNSQSCQDCHMPVLADDMPISSVLGQPREHFSQHVFRGGNSIMLTILAKYRGELGVQALPQELAASIQRTRQFLGTDTAAISIDSVSRSDDVLSFEIDVRNLAGHKLPTAYPSRRAWLHVTVSDRSGTVVFESGALRPNGSIVGNANDSDAAAYEPHYREITNGDQVQIYESILADSQDRVTTGLLYGVRYAKDSRLLPTGFDKRSVGSDIAVAGAAFADPDFQAGGDRVRYRIRAGSRAALTVSAELVYQSIGYRWAENLAEYSAPETDRFVGFYRETIDGAAVRLAAASVTAD